MLFREMEEGDLAGSQSLRKERFVEYIAKSLAYCVKDGGMLVGFVLCRNNGREFIVDAMAAKNREVCDFLMKGIFYSCGEVESILVTRDANPGKLDRYGFFETKDGTAFKIMRESTWQEGTFYPHGGLVIEELLYGDSRVLGA